MSPGLNNMHYGAPLPGQPSLPGDFLAFTLLTSTVGAYR